MLSNIVLYDKKLSYNANDPYKTFIEESKKAQNEPNVANWCGIVDALQTCAVEEYGNQKLLN